MKKHKVILSSRNTNLVKAEITYLMNMASVTDIFKHIDKNSKFKTRLVDCVGYLVDNAIGYLEDDMPRMVKTPWSDEEIPFETAAEIGTKKVIEEHSTIGILVTTDGTVTDIPREDYIQAEERV